MCMHTHTRQDDTSVVVMTGLVLAVLLLCAGVMALAAAWEVLERDVCV